MSRTLSSLVVLALAWAVATPADAQRFGTKSEKELTQEADTFIRNKPEPLKPFFHTLYMEGEWNSVLNFNLLSLAALEAGHRELAEKAMDQSTARILRIYADDANAAKARSLWSAEGVKDFKGEPYERAAAFLYRGLLYIGEGDLQNARAAFLQAELQNAMGQTEKYPSSFALPLYLAAWASACDGDPARGTDLLERARKTGVDPYFKGHPNKLPRHITLIERGIGPEKVTLGTSRNILGFLPQPDLNGQVKVVYVNPPAGQAFEGTAGNVDWLALTRGGRPIQGILDGKASFKETTGSLAEGTQQVASALYQSLGQLGGDKLSVARNIAGLGAGAQVVSLLAGMASRNTDAEADTRYWGSLPKHWHIEAFEEGAPLAAKHLQSSYAKTPRPLLLSLPKHAQCSFAYLREFSALYAMGGGVGNPSPWPAEPKETNRADVNQAFRNMLKSMF